MFVSLLLLLFTTGSVFGGQFIVDYENDRFLKDGRSFQYVSGSIHYFRVPWVLWRDRLTSLRSSGANAVETYIEWSSHEPEPGQFNFDGQNNINLFIEIADSLGLVVILRPGPFIDAERDFGGFPYWLFREGPNMRLRSNDETYKKLVERWYSVVLPRIRPQLYSNGGPVIMVQVENEYGSYPDCSFEYTTWLRDITRKYLRDQVVLFTTDGYSDNALRCGKIDGTLTTVDFGTNVNPENAFKVQKRHQEKGPKVNSEFYPGWLDHWQEKHNTISSQAIVSSMDKMLSLNASFNIYMFHGGTSFGFTAGSNMGSKFQACPTSYDYDAPLSEAGDATAKLHEMRKVITKYLPEPAIPIPEPKPKMIIRPFELEPIMDVFDFVSKFSQDSIFSPQALSFEQVGQPSGYLLYMTTFPAKPSDPTKLSIPGIRDRAFVFVDSKYQGTLSREDDVTSIPIRGHEGSRLEILVENQGRICFTDAVHEHKGLTGDVSFGPLKLGNWTHLKVPLESPDAIEQLMAMDAPPMLEVKKNVPGFFRGTFLLDSELVFDTFLNVRGWKKGVAFLNGFNLGRYWPEVGPQETLYAPGHLFKPYPEENVLILFETESAPKDGHRIAQFVDYHVINSTVPFS